MKIVTIGAELWEWVGGRTDGHDEADSCFSQICESPKNGYDENKKVAARRKN